MTSIRVITFIYTVKVAPTITQLIVSPTISFYRYYKSKRYYYMLQ